MRLKVFICCLMAAAALLSLFACAKKEPPEAGASPDAAESSVPAQKPQTETEPGAEPDITLPTMPASLDLSNGYGYNEFLVLAATAEAQGDACAEQGLKTQAYTFYAAAACELGSLRFGIEHLIAAKTDALTEDVFDGSIYTSWEELAALFPASPYPDYFEGLSRLGFGENDAAEKCWKNAVANAAYPDEGLAFTYLTDMRADELTALRDQLRGLETALFSKYTPQLLYVERTPENSFTEYLLSMARIKLEEEDFGEAMRFSEAAILTDPFDGSCFASAAVCALAANDLESMAIYLNEGLLIAPEHEGLNMLLEAYGHGGDEDEASQ